MISLHATLHILAWLACTIKIPARTLAQILYSHTPPKQKMKHTKIACKSLARQGCTLMKEAH